MHVYMYARLDGRILATTVGSQYYIHERESATEMATMRTMTIAMQSVIYSANWSFRELFTGVRTEES